jgi:hypothetical protein
MQQNNTTDKTTTEECRENSADVTREALYSLVWAEPMLKVAAKFGVSSSYMARVCAWMNVPRPERGYWAKLAVGKQSPKPELPEASPGAPMLWDRSGISNPVRRVLPRPPSIRPIRNSKAIKPRAELHGLIRGARLHFDVARTSYDSNYLKPAKRLLVDLVVSKASLDKALSFASDLFSELEAHDCRVLIAPVGEQLRRAYVDEHEVPQKRRNDNYDNYHRLWSPGRITVTYVGTVPIGLTVIELSEEAEARYVKGEYVRAHDQEVFKRSRHVDSYSWTTKRDFPTGRLCLQAYCPDWRGEWTKQWRETKERGLTSQIPSIVLELIDAATVLAKLIQEGQCKAELQRQKWEEEARERERQRAEELAIKAREDSAVELLKTIEAWAQFKRIEQFCADVEAGLAHMTDDQRDLVRDRLIRAREFVGDTDAMHRFLEWKTPNERLQILDRVPDEQD